MRLCGLHNIRFPTHIVMLHSKNVSPSLGVLTCSGCENKAENAFLLFFKIDLCSAISFKWSRRELSIDVAECVYLEKLPKYVPLYYF